jgi:type I site-specific restriction-modification system R (restriction) subunit
MDVNEPMKGHNLMQAIARMNRVIEQAETLADTWSAQDA